MDLTHPEIPTDGPVMPVGPRGRVPQRSETRKLSGGAQSHRSRARCSSALASLSTLLAFLGLVGLAAGCRVPSPTVRQGLDYGFRTPKQAFESWRTAVQGNLLAEEYGCFSRRWRAENGGVTLQMYGEVRDRLLDEYPQLRWAVYQAEAPEEYGRTERGSLLVSKVPAPLFFKDRYLIVQLRKQGFWELSVEETPRQPEFRDEVSDPIDSQLFYYDDSSDRFFVIVPGFSDETDLAGAEAIHLATAGWEWKIDQFEIVDELPTDVTTID